MPPASPHPGHRQAWVDHAIWWHVYPLGFAGADVTGADRAPTEPDFFDRLVRWLDYAVRLGVSGIALGPIFESSSHGYDTVDHFRIDTRLGSIDGFDRLVAEAKRRGLRLLLDGVFNHVAPTFSLGSPEWQTGEVFEGHVGLRQLDHSHPDVARHVADVMGHWLERGADGWRLDAAYAIPPQFWSRLLPELRGRFPEAWFVGEMIHGDYAAYVTRSGLDAVTQYELWKAVWSSIGDANFFELAWALDRHNRWLDTFVPMTFVGNHDVTRLATRLGRRREVSVALAALLTVGGTPSVYYGDEQGFEGVKEDRVGGDDAVRPAFPLDESGLDPCGWDLYRTHQDLIGLRRRHPWLHRARTRVVDLANRRFTYECVDPAGGSSLMVSLDLDSDPGWSATGA
ncbi:MAG TPA: alpha-amylase family glycosyl hydrolase [Acidimicrobiales bacterium]|nr:alpha-amylase family glycosyl hydrolase [Acidimicrobiales bacterium]